MEVATDDWAYKVVTATNYNGLVEKYFWSKKDAVDYASKRDKDRDAIATFVYDKFGVVAHFIFWVA